MVTNLGTRNYRFYTSHTTPGLQPRVVVCSFEKPDSSSGSVCSTYYYFLPFSHFPQQWGLCALHHGIQISMEAILACHPARSTEWLDCHPKSCEPWRIRTGPIVRYGASRALLKDLEKVQLRVASGQSNRQESDFAGRVNASTGSSPDSVVAKARTLPRPSLAALYWERSSCTAGLTGALCVATVHSLSSPLSFSFCFIVSSLVVLYLSKTQVAFDGVSSLLRLYPLLGQPFAATFSRICSAMVSLSSFSHIHFVGFTIFLYFAFMFQQFFFVSLFSSSSSPSISVCGCVCVCVCVCVRARACGCELLFHSPRGKAPIASCYWPILFKRLCSINK